MREMREKIIIGEMREEEKRVEYVMEEEGVNERGREKS